MKKITALKLFSFFAIACMPSSILAQQKAFIGQVVDQASKQPLEGATITEIPGKKLFIVGRNGIFNISAEADSFIISYAGYVPAIVKVTADSFRYIALAHGAPQLKDIIVFNSYRLDTYKALSAIDLGLQPVKSAQDMLRLVPGLFIAQHMGGGKAEQIFLRGFDADHGTDINIAVDGLPVNMVTHAHGQGYADMHFIIPETIASYDFGKGPYYADKGDFATAGFVAYSTRTSLAENTVKVEAGRYNTYRAVAMLNLVNTLDKPKGQSAYVAAEGLFSDGGPFELPEHFRRFNLFTKYIKKIGGNTTLTAIASTFYSKWRSSGELPDRAVDEGYVNSRFGVIDPAQGGITHRTNFSVKLQNFLANGWTLEQQLFYSAYNFNLVSNFTFFYYYPETGDEFRQTEVRNIAGYNGKLSKHWQIGNIVLTSDAGISTRFDNINPVTMAHTNKGSFIEYFRLDKANELNNNIWVNETVKYGKWLFGAGLRADHLYFNSTNILHQEVDSNGRSASKIIISPKLNVAYNINGATQVYIKVGKGFHSNDARVVLANQGLKVLPAAYGIDVGTNIKPAENIFVNAAVWYLYLQQEFVFGQDLSDQLEGPVSPSGRTTRLGADVSIRYQVNKWLYANINANLAKPRCIDSVKGYDYLELAPTLTSTASIAFNCKNGLYGGISCRYLHNRPGNADNSLIAHGYFITDAAVNYRHKRYEIGLAIENLFNTTWNESQIAYTTRLKNESTSTEQTSYTPGVPFYPKLKWAMFFK